MSGATPIEWTHEALQARIDRAPFNRWLGLELETWGPGSITMRMRARPEVLGHEAIGALHGGVLAAVLDTACSMAVVTATGGSVYTVDMRVDYLRPATAASYIIRAHVVRRGRTLATTDAVVESAEGQAVASGRAVLQQIPLLTKGE